VLSFDARAQEILQIIQAYPVDVWDKPWMALILQCAFDVMPPWVLALLRQPSACAVQNKPRAWRCSCRPSLCSGCSTNKGCLPLHVNACREVQAVLDVALLVQDDVLAHQWQHTLRSMGARVARCGLLSNDAKLWRSRPCDLMVVHTTPTAMDLVNTFMPDPYDAQRAATLALVPDHHMAFASDLLDAGFDRCLPLSLHEAVFCAVVRALTRRRQGMVASVSHYGALSFNHATQQARVAGVALDLTPREAQVLDILLKRVGQIIPKERLLQDIAPDNMALNTTAAEVYIHRLRKKSATRCYQFAASSAAVTFCRVMRTSTTVACANPHCPSRWWLQFGLGISL